MHVPYHWVFQAFGVRLANLWFLCPKFQKVKGHHFMVIKAHQKWSVLKRVIPLRYIVREERWVYKRSVNRRRQVISHIVRCLRSYMHYEHLVSLFLTNKAKDFYKIISTVVYHSPNLHEINISFGEQLTKNVHLFSRVFPIFLHTTEPYLRDYSKEVFANMCKNLCISHFPHLVSRTIGLYLMTSLD